jgi:hypothetical protein
MFDFRENRYNVPVEQLSINLATLTTNFTSLLQPACVRPAWVWTNGVKVPCGRTSVQMLEKSRVTTTTSLRQGRFREEGSEGSQRQKCEPTDRNVIEGRVPGASWHNTTKPNGSGDTVNDAVAHGQFMFLSGEICPFGSH